MSVEATVVSDVRLDAAQCGIDLWRNNVGVAFDKNGRAVRFGLCNDSPKMNKEIKSSDWIGITPVVITPDMVGQTIGVFTALEMKKSDWVFSPKDERACAQWRFHEIVRKAGGFAGFVCNVFDFRRIVKR